MHIRHLFIMGTTFMSDLDLPNHLVQDSIGLIFLSCCDPNMSKSLKQKKKKNHWTNRVHEVVLSRDGDGQLGFTVKGGAEIGQFPLLDLHGCPLVQDELLLEVNDTPVAGLTVRDVLAVVRHCKDPVRLKCVQQGTSTGPLFGQCLSS
ncbi:hypothetical protein NFI96_005446 [Prochilodus magdalenae]|nr:hypothetical protein NFI96_005446 [Prochilodus magdalenae]